MLYLILFQYFFQSKTIEKYLNVNENRNSNSKYLNLILKCDKQQPAKGIAVPTQSCM